MKKEIIPAECSTERAMAAAASYVRLDHFAFKREEIKQGKKLFMTYGDWKKKNPHHPDAKKSWDDNEYMEIIAAFPEYFDRLHELNMEKTNKLGF